MSWHRALLLLPLLWAAQFFLPHAAALDDDSDKATITGTVVDAEGKPVPDAEVSYLDYRIPPVRTDAVGRFSIKLRWPTASGLLMASDKGAAHMALLDVSDTGVPYAAQTAEMRLTLLPSASLNVKVVDAEGASVRGAKVVAMHQLTAIVSAVSGADGTVRLRLPANTSLHHVFAMKPGAGFDYFENFKGSPYPFADPLPAKVTLILEGARKVQVKAVGTDGKPVAGVEFHPWTFKKQGRQSRINLSGAAFDVGLQCITDAVGIATFDYLPRTIEGETQFELNDIFYSQQQTVAWNPEATPPTVALPPLVTASVLRQQTISGKVLLPDGKPAAGIMVYADGRGFGDDEGSGIARTRTDGTFTMIGVDPEKSYIVGINEKDWAARSATGVIVKESEPRTGLVLQLTKGTLLRGTVTSRKTGKPVPRERVTVVEVGEVIDHAKLAGSVEADFVHEEGYRIPLTDDEGRYSIRLGPGTYRISLLNPDDETPPITITDQAELVRNLQK
jgi:hypothetical protein